MIRFQFDRKFIPLVAPFAAKLDIRYYLNGIRVEAAGDRPGVYIVGCDGHRLTVAYDKTGIIEGVEGGVVMRVPPQFISACKARSSLPLKVICEGDRISINVENGTAHSERETYVMPGKPWIEGNYPKWRDILPCWADLKLGFASEVSSVYLADYLKLNSGGRYGDGLVFWQTVGGAPIVVQHTSQPEIVSILMPRRTDGSDFLRKKLSEVAAGKQKVTP